MPCSHRDLTRERRLTLSIFLLLLPAVSPLVQHSHLPLLRVRGKPWPPAAQSCPSQDTSERLSPESRSLNTRIIFFLQDERVCSLSPERRGRAARPGERLTKKDGKGKIPVPVPAAPGGTPATPPGRGGRCDGIWGAAAATPLALGCRTRSVRSPLPLRPRSEAGPGPGDPRPGRCRRFAPVSPSPPSVPLDIPSKPLNSGDFTIGAAPRRAGAAAPSASRGSGMKPPRVRLRFQRLRANGTDRRRQ